MALQKDKDFKGVVANYWKIISCKYNAISKYTTVTMALYFSKETRDADVANRLPDADKDFQFVGELTVEQAYGKITESVLGKREITPAVYDDTTPTPTLITPAVTEDYETNEFFNAPLV